MTPRSPWQSPPPSRALAADMQGTGQRPSTAGRNELARPGVPRPAPGLRHGAARRARRLGRRARAGPVAPLADCRGRRGGRGGAWWAAAVRGRRRRAGGVFRLLCGCCGAALRLLVGARVRGGPLRIPYICPSRVSNVKCMLHSLKWMRCILYPVYLSSGSLLLSTTLYYTLLTSTRVSLVCIYRCLGLPAGGISRGCRVLEGPMCSQWMDR